MLAPLSPYWSWKSGAKPRKGGENSVFNFTIFRKGLDRANCSYELLHKSLPEKLRETLRTSLGSDWTLNYSSTTFDLKLEDGLISHVNIFLSKCTFRIESISGHSGNTFIRARSGHSGNALLQLHPGGRTRMKQMDPAVDPGFASAASRLLFGYQISLEVPSIFIVLEFTSWST
ncbi:unnamed protein product [Cuscuta campestris]|uniref:Uncharacterized protein n=1 Tax=Cuscuta campestris TaxID=132261 RepID=A0A484M4F4_9ASTE|nr:unnamed protein product [Cuscuta campestris]